MNIERRKFIPYRRKTDLLSIIIKLILILYLIITLIDDTKEIDWTIALSLLRTIG